MLYFLLVIIWCDTSHSSGACPSSIYSKEFSYISPLISWILFPINFISFRYQDLINILLLLPLYAVCIRQNILEKICGRFLDENAQPFFVATEWLNRGVFSFLKPGWLGGENQGRLQSLNRTGAQFEENQRLRIRIFNFIQDIPNLYLKSEIRT